MAGDDSKIILELGADVSEVSKALNSLTPQIEAAIGGSVDAFAKLSTASSVASAGMLSEITKATKGIQAALTTAFKPDQLVGDINSMAVNIEKMKNIMVAMGTAISEGMKQANVAAHQGAAGVSAAMSATANAAQNAANKTKDAADKAGNSLKSLSREVSNVNRSTASSLQLKIDPKSIVDPAALSTFFRNAFGDALNKTKDMVKQESDAVFAPLGAALAQAMNKAAKRGDKGSVQSEALRTMATQIQSGAFDMRDTDNLESALKLMREKDASVKEEQRRQALINEILGRQADLRHRILMVNKEGASLDKVAQTKREALVSLETAELADMAALLRIRTSEVANEEKARGIQVDRIKANREAIRIVTERSRIEADGLEVLRKAHQLGIDDAKLKKLAALEIKDVIGMSEKDLELRRKENASQAAAVAKLKEEVAGKRESVDQDERRKKIREEEARLRDRENRVAHQASLAAHAANPLAPQDPLYTAPHRDNKEFEEELKAAKTRLDFSSIEQRQAERRRDVEEAITKLLGEQVDDKKSIATLDTEIVIQQILTKQRLQESAEKRFEQRTGEAAPKKTVIDEHGNETKEAYNTYTRDQLRGMTTAQLRDVRFEQMVRNDELRVAKDNAALTSDSARSDAQKGKEEADTDRLRLVLAKEAQVTEAHIAYLSKRGIEFEKQTKEYKAKTLEDLKKLGLDKLQEEAKANKEAQVKIAEGYKKLRGDRDDSAITAKALKIHERMAKVLEEEAAFEGKKYNETEKIAKGQEKSLKDLEALNLKQLKDEETSLAVREKKIEQARELLSMEEKRSDYVRRASKVEMAKRSALRDDSDATPAIQAIESAAATMTREEYRLQNTELKKQQALWESVARTMKAVDDMMKASAGTMQAMTKAAHDMYTEEIRLTAEAASTSSEQKEALLAGIRARLANETSVAEVEKKQVELRERMVKLLAEEKRLTTATSSWDQSKKFTVRPEHAIKEATTPEDIGNITDRTTLAILESELAVREKLAKAASEDVKEEKSRLDFARRVYAQLEATYTMTKKMRGKEGVAAQMADFADPGSREDFEKLSREEIEKKEKEGINQRSEIQKGRRYLDDQSNKDATSRKGSKADRIADKMKALDERETAAGITPANLGPLGKAVLDSKEILGLTREQVRQLEASNREREREVSRQEQTKILLEKKADLVAKAASEETKLAARLGGDVYKKALSVRGGTELLTTSTASGVDASSAKNTRELKAANAALQEQKMLWGQISAAIESLEDMQAAKVKAGTALTEAEYAKRLDTVLAASDAKAAIALRQAYDEERENAKIQTEKNKMLEVRNELLARQRSLVHRTGVALKETIPTEHEIVGAASTDLGIRQQQLEKVEKELTLEERRAEVLDRISSTRLKAQAMLGKDSLADVQVGGSRSPADPFSDLETHYSSASKAAKIANLDQLEAIEERFKIENSLLNDQARVLAALDKARITSLKTASAMTFADYDKRRAQIMSLAREELAGAERTLQAEIRNNVEHQKAADIAKARFDTMRAITDAQVKEAKATGGTTRSSRYNSLRASAGSASSKEDLDRIKAEVENDSKLYAFKIQLLNEWLAAYKGSQKTATKISQAEHETMVKNVQGANEAALASYAETISERKRQVDQEIALISKTSAAQQKSVDAHKERANKIATATQKMTTLMQDLIRSSMHAVEQSSEFAEHIRTVAEETGESYEESQRTLGMITTFGVPAASAERAIKMMSHAYKEAVENGGEALKRFNAMGISLAQLNATGGDASRMLMLVNDALQNTEQPMLRVSQAAELIGRGNVQMLAALTTGSDALKKARKSVDVLTEDQEKGLLRMAAAYNMFTNSIKVKVAGLVNELSPVFYKMMSTMLMLLVKITPVLTMLVKILEAVSPAVVTFGTVLLPVILVLSKLYSTVGAVATAMSVGMLPALGVIAGVTLVVGGLAYAIASWTGALNDNSAAVDSNLKNHQAYQNYIQNIKTPEDPNNPEGPPAGQGKQTSGPGEGQHTIVNETGESRWDFGAHRWTQEQKRLKAQELSSRFMALNDQLTPKRQRLYELQSSMDHAVRIGYEFDDEKGKAELIRLKKEIKEIHNKKEEIKKDIAALQKVDIIDGDGKTKIIPAQEYYADYREAHDKMRERIKARDNIRQKEVMDFRDSQLQALSVSQLVTTKGGEADKQREAIHHATNKMISDAMHANAVAASKSIKAKQDEIREKLKLGQEMTVEEIKEASRSAREQIRVRWMAEEERQNLLRKVEEFEVEAIRKRSRLVMAEEIELARERNKVAFERAEIELSEQLTNGTISRGVAERELFNLKQRQHAAEIAFEKEAADIRRKSYKERRAELTASLHEATSESYKLKKAANQDKSIDPAIRKQMYVEAARRDQDAVVIRGELTALSKEERKSEADSTHKIAREQMAMTGQKMQHLKDVSNGWLKAQKDMEKMEAQLSDNPVDRAHAQAEAQIDSYQQVAEAALEKAHQIEDAAEREKAVQDTLTRLAKDEAALRANLLKTMREGYQSEFGQIFDFMKEMGAMSKEMAESMRDAVEQEIVSLARQRGMAALASGEGAKLLATYKKIQDELNPKKGQGFGIGLGASWDMGAIKDDKGAIISKSLFDDDLSKSANPSMMRLKEKIGEGSLKGVESSMKALIRNFTGENGLAANSEHLGSRFKSLAEVAESLKKKMGAMVAEVNKQGRTTVPTVKEKEERLVGDRGIIGQYRYGQGSYGTFVDSDGNVYKWHGESTDSMRSSGPGRPGQSHYDPKNYNRGKDPSGIHNEWYGESPLMTRKPTAKEREDNQGFVKSGLMRRLNVEQPHHSTVNNTNSNNKTNISVKLDMGGMSSATRALAERLGTSLMTDVTSKNAGHSVFTGGKR